MVEPTNEELKKNIENLTQSLDKEKADHAKDLDRLKELEGQCKEEKPLTLAEKIAKASQAMGAVAKDGYNKSQGGWNFISESAIKTAARRVMSQYGFAIIPKSIKEVVRYERKTSKGGTLYFYDVTQTFLITDGKESYESEMMGTGSDSGDKAFNKAVTVALKNFEKQLFNVSDQDEDPDAITPPETTSQPTKYQSTQPMGSSKRKTTKQDLLNYSIVFNGTQTDLGTLLKHYNAGNKAAIDFANSLTGESKFAFESLKQME